MVFACSQLDACIQEMAKLNEEDLLSGAGLLIYDGNDSSNTLGEPARCVLP